VGSKLFAQACTQKPLGKIRWRAYWIAKAFMESIGAEGETPTPSAYFFKKIYSRFSCEKN